MTQADKLAQAQELEEAIATIQSLHRTAFPPAQPPVAPPAPPIDERSIRRDHEKAALHGISLFDRTSRKRAKAEAAVAAEAEIAAARRSAEEQRSAIQEQLDEYWQRLVANDEEVVLSTLEEAFEDNEAPAIAVGVEHGEVALVVLVPNESVLPERKPSITAAGNLSLKRLTKRERADLYKVLVCGYLLTTARETFAVAVGLDAARIVVLRHQDRDAYGRHRAECVLACRLTRRSLDGIRWGEADAIQIVNDAAEELVMHQKGASKELQALDLGMHPELAALVRAVDLEALASSSG